MKFPNKTGKYFWVNFQTNFGEKNRILEQNAEGISKEICRKKNKKNLSEAFVGTPNLKRISSRGYFR